MNERSLFRCALVLLVCITLIQCACSTYVLIIGCDCIVNEQNGISYCNTTISSFDLNIAMVLTNDLTNLVLSAVFLCVTILWQDILDWGGFKWLCWLSLRDGRTRMFHLTLWPVSVTLLLYYVVNIYHYNLVYHNVLDSSWFIVGLNFVLIAMNNIRTSIICFLNLRTQEGCEDAESGLSACSTETINPVDSQHQRRKDVSEESPLLDVNLSYCEKRKRICTMINLICFSAMVYNGVLLIYDIFIAFLMVNSWSTPSIATSVLAVWYRTIHTNYYFAKLNCPDINVLTGSYPSLEITYKRNTE